MVTAPDSLFARPIRLKAPLGNKDMKSLFAAAVALGLFAAPASAQTASSAAPAPAPAAQAPLVIPKPTYVSAVMEVTVNRPAAQVWARVGKFCDIGEWLGRRCAITSGTDGELGAVRTLDGTIIEVLISKTQFSYSYAQPVRQGVPYITARWRRARSARRARG